MVFKILNSTNSQWFVRIIASNGKTLAHSETYWNKADARNAAQVIMREASTSRIEE